MRTPLIILICALSINNVPGQIQLADILDSVYFRDGINRVGYLLEGDDREIHYVEDTSLSMILSATKESKLLNIKVYQDDVSLHKQLPRRIIPLWKKFVHWIIERYDVYKVNLKIESISNQIVVIQVDIGRVNRSSYQNGIWHLAREQRILVRYQILKDGSFVFDKVLN